MTPKKFVGASSREVLQKVRQALGDDALIVSNRPVHGGIEITALAASALSAGVGSPVPAADGIVQHLKQELDAMKALLQRELSGIAWTDLRHRAPVQAATMQALLGSGFSPALARELTATLPERASNAAARKLVNSEIERRLIVADGESLVEQGGVYALIGPTGVGKTTTVAKLAARCVVRNGAQNLALLTTDSYRIAGHDQLRIYGKILGVPVHAIRDVEDLKGTLADLGTRKTVLIDTIGMSQRDRLVAEQGALLNGGGQVKRLLLLNATANAATLDEVIAAYAPNGVHGCIITKVDESASVATALDGAIRHRLAIHYVTNGQRVPEDLHLPNRAYLMHRALQPARNGEVHGLLPEEYPMVMAGAMQGAAHG